MRVHDATDVPDPTIQTLAQNLKALRKARGWSQADLAHRTGVHITHVSRVETGKYLPAIDFVMKTAKAFGVSLDQLLGDLEEQPEITIEDKDLAERVRLLESLAKDERDALVKVIDAVLTKHRIQQILEKKTA